MPTSKKNVFIFLIKSLNNAFFRVVFILNVINFEVYVVQIKLSLLKCQFLLRLRSNIYYKLTDLRVGTVNIPVEM